MSTPYLHKVSTARTAVFKVVDTNGVAVTGLTDGSFTKAWYKDAVSDATATTITEIANGFYKWVATPGSSARWKASWYITANPEYGSWDEELDVQAAGSGADELADLASAVDTYTIRGALRLILAACAGKSSGGPGSPVIRSANDSKNRITATCDANNNRTAITLDAT